LDSKILVNIFGIGSPFGDDAIGILIGEHLTSLIDNKQPSIKVTILDRPTIALTNLLQPNIPTIIIDAMVSGAVLGEMREFTLDNAPHAFSPRSSHAFGVLESLQLAKSLGKLPNECLLFGIEIQSDCKPTQMLSEGLKKKIPQFTKQILNRAQDLLESLRH
jgi:hydrogenase maturation protease